MALLGEKAPVLGVGAALLRVPEGHDQTGHSLACGSPGKAILSNTSGSATTQFLPAGGRYRLCGMLAPSALEWTNR